MCKRNTNDVLVRRFLDRYQVNLLSMPGRRVRCGSVYIQEGGRLTAPGDLNDILEPKITLGAPFIEDQLPDLSGAWSDSVEAKVGIGLLENFLTALGAAGLIDELKASVKVTGSRNISVRFEKVSRESLSPIALGAALVGCGFAPGNPWVRDGNRYYAVAAVLRSNAISVRGSDQSGRSVDLGAAVTSIADVDAGVDVKKEGSTALTYAGQDSLVIGVELYELRRDPVAKAFSFHTLKGPLAIRGLTDNEPPDPAFISDDVMIDVLELEPGAGLRRE